MEQAAGAERAGDNSCKTDGMGLVGRSKTDKTKSLVVKAAKGLRIEDIIGPLKSSSKVHAKTGAAKKDTIGPLRGIVGTGAEIGRGATAR